MTTRSLLLPLLLLLAAAGAILPAGAALGRAEPEVAGVSARYGKAAPRRAAPLSCTPPARDAASVEWRGARPPLLMGECAGVAARATLRAASAARNPQHCQVRSAAGGRRHGRPVLAGAQRLGRGAPLRRLPGTFGA
eukprot:scaffold1175_cov330-Prasinococcus_capsulatus_cf.AAC.9